MSLSIENNSDIKKKLLTLIINSKGRSHSFIIAGIKETKKSSITKAIVCELLQTKKLNIHSNILWINTSRKNINVAEIRRISNFMYKTTYHANLPKLIVIDVVDNLNLHSLNALLKILEEPTKNTYFILIANNLGILPDTIKSRGIIIKLPPPSISAIHLQIKQQFPNLSDTQLDEYFFISSISGTITALTSDTLEIYKQLLKLLQIKSRIPTNLYKFIEENFATLKQLETLHILIKNLIHKTLKAQISSPISIISTENKVIKKMTTKNTRLLLSINQEMDSFMTNSKTLGLDIKTVALVMVNKIKSLAA